MDTIKGAKRMESEKKDKASARKPKLRTLTVRSGITAGLARAGCTPCHVPSNHNETLVRR